MVLLSFDIEEFDVPTEHGVDIDIDRMMEVSVYGTNKILDILKRNGVKATFFCTANYAMRAHKEMKRIVEEGHEVASHGFYHSSFEENDLITSKSTLEKITDKPVVGYRQARMMPVSEQSIYDAGYKYNSSINPTWIPGRYMHLSIPRIPFMKNEVLQIPVSVTPFLRFPLFWLSCHNLPMNIYLWLVRQTLKHDGLYTVYFHPWEFYSLKEHKEWKLPYIITKNSGDGMQNRLDKLVGTLKRKGEKFVTYSEYLNNHTTQL